MVRVDKIKAFIVNRYRHFFPLMLKIGIRVNDDEEDPMPYPAWITRQGPIELSKRFLSSGQFTEREWVFIVMHELMHRILRHFDRAEIIKVQHFGLWNIATDLAINFMLTRMGFTPPAEIQAMLNTYSLYRNKPAESIYYDLLKKAQSLKPWLQQLIQAAEKCRIDSHPESGLDGDLDPVTNEMVKAALTEMVEKLQGQVPGWLERYIGEINKVNTSWFEKLRRYMTEVSNIEGYTSKTYFPPSDVPNPIDPDIIMPRYVGNDFNPTIVIDVSSSVPQDLLTEFVSHAAAIVDELTGGERLIKLGFVDADEPQFIDVFPTQVIQLIKKTKIKGGGGTIFDKCFERLNEIKPDIVVFFTDGYADYPKEPPDYPVVWVMPEEGSAREMRWGEVIRIPTRG